MTEQTARAWLAERLATDDEPYSGADYLTPAERRRMARYLEAYGEWFVPTPLAKEIPGGVPGACFANSLRFLVTGWPYFGPDAGVRLQYVEGVCFNRKAPVLRAWNALPGDARTLDTTYGWATEWEQPARFLHYARPEEVACVGLRVPRDVAFALWSLGALDAGRYGCLLEAPGVLEALEADAGADPQRALLVWAQGELARAAQQLRGRKGVGDVRRQLDAVREALRERSEADDQYAQRSER